MRPRYSGRGRSAVASEWRQLGDVAAQFPFFAKSVKFWSGDEVFRGECLVGKQLVDEVEGVIILPDENQPIEVIYGREFFRVPLFGLFGDGLRAQWPCLK